MLRLPAAGAKEKVPFHKQVMSFHRVSTEEELTICA